MKIRLLIVLLAISGIVNAQPLIVPVVFHVVYNNSSQNVADSFLVKQLQRLNMDYSDTTCLNTYTQDVNTDIQFAFAQQDPSGNPTNGILRRSTTITTFSSDNKVKFTAQGGDDIWDRDNYLNIWVCNLGVTQLGYCPFPTCSSSNAATDGLVISYCTVKGTCAPFDLGRTASTELGHWFGLAHVGSSSCAFDGDSISDTPIQTNYSQCGTSTVSSCSGIADSILVKNFMGDSYDACKCFFTPGQKAKMWSVINNCRSSLKTSVGGNPPAGMKEDKYEKHIQVYPNPFYSETTLQMDGFFKVATLIVYNSYGQAVKQLENLSGKTITFNRGNLPSGLYFIRLMDETTVLATDKLVITDK